MKRYVDARGKQCPIPVVETRKALELMGEGDVVETLVDNEIAVQNLLKMAKQKKVDAQVEQFGADEYRVSFSRTEESPGESREKAIGKDEPQEETAQAEKVQPKELNLQEKTNQEKREQQKEPNRQEENRKKDSSDEKNWQGDSGKEETAKEKEAKSREERVVVAISSDKMGQGDDTLGEILMKGFLYALTGLPSVPKTVLFYNGGAKLSVEGSAALSDLKRLEEMGTEILTCGTCLNYYGLTDKLAVGKITDMYTICEKLAEADKVVRP